MRARVSAESRVRIADYLDALADGESIELGEFGDAATATAADEDASGIRELADLVRHRRGTFGPLLD